MKDIELKLQELFDNKTEYINSIFWGFKTIKNQLTNQQCFIFSVQNKKPKEELLEKELIPAYIEINNQKYSTDVIEINNIEPLLCYRFDSFIDPIVQEHRSKVRPLKGGISITTTSYCGYANIGSGINFLKPYKFGTLGAIVVDNLTNTLVGLTAGHIVSRDISFAHTRNFNSSRPYNIYDSQTLPVYNLDNNGNLVLSSTLRTIEKYTNSIAQFNETGEFINISSNDIIGEPKRYIPVYSGTNPSGNNFADAGVFTLKPGSINIPESNQQLNLTSSSGLLFASSGEIYDAFTGQKNMYSAGRTTGPKGNVPCELIIGGLAGSITVNNYEINGLLNQPIVFKDILILNYKNNSSYPAAEGDSGSVIYGDFSGVKKIVGLIFAGSPGGNTSIAYASRIDRISGLLNISPWTGDIKNFDNKATKSTTLEEKNQTGILINKFGNTYSQGGIISSFIAPEDEFVGEEPLNRNDMIVSYLNSFQGLNSYESVFDISIETAIDRFPVPNAAVTYQILVTNQIESCCNDESDCFNPSQTILRSVTNKTNTASDGSLRVSMRNTSEDGLCFLLKILNVEKPNYVFLPSASVSLQKLQIASPEVISDSTNNDPLTPVSDPRPLPDGDETFVNDGDSGTDSSSGTGGDESSGGGSTGGPMVTPDGSVSTSGGGSANNTTTTGVEGERGGYKGCCEDVLNFDDTKFNVTVFCQKLSKTVRIAISVEATVDIKKLTCKETNLQTKVFFYTYEYSMGWIQIGRNNIISKEFFIPINDFKKLADSPSTPLTFKIYGKYNDRNCYQDNRKNQRYDKIFKYRVKWNNALEGENDILGPHCFGTVSIPGAGTCPAQCCNCCELMFDKARLNYIEQCYPSLSPHPPCTPIDNIQRSEPVWVGCQEICNTKSRTLNTASEPQRLMCEKGLQFCWPCRPKTCLECSVGVQSLELLNILPLGLDNFLPEKSLDEEFKTNILHELSLE